jgi:hypothetical protein
MDNIARGIRHAARQLWRAPLVSVASMLTLAIGIGACTLMMSVVSTVLLKPLPYGDPDRLVMSWGWYPNANLGFPEQPTHGAVFSIMRDNTQAFESLAAFRGASFNFGDVISAERLDGIEATGHFFAALGVAPEIGHFFERANETPGSDHVADLKLNSNPHAGEDSQIIEYVPTQAGTRHFPAPVESGRAAHRLKTRTSGPDRQRTC